MAVSLAEVKTALDRLVADIQVGITAIQDLTAQLAAALANQADPAEIQAILDEVNQIMAALEAALPVPPAP